MAVNFDVYIRLEVGCASDIYVNITLVNEKAPQLPIGQL